MNSYEFTQLGKNLKITDQYYYSYKFQTCCGKRYLVEVTLLHENLAEFAFFLAKDQKANYSIKFGRLANLKYPRKVLRTCISIARNFMDTHNPDTSFIFLGFPKPNKEDTLRETTRYRIYKSMASLHFNPETWKHLYNKETSIYLLLNKNSLFYDSSADKLYQEYEQGILDRIAN